MSYVETLILSKYFTNPRQLITATIISLIITRLIIFPWQLVGLFRATENDYIKHGNTLKTRSIQAVMILSMLFTLVYVLESIQTVIYNNVIFNNKERIGALTSDDKQSTYTLKIKNKGQRLHIKGIFVYGITDSVRKTIEANPGVNSVTLESPGGHVYEGRGLSYLITQHGLDTYSYEECSSACATAFVGGKRRHLGSNGKIGFHRYKLETTSLWNYLPYFDISSEQQKDLSIFSSQGVQQKFMDRMFEQTPDQMWFPTHQDLIEAGFIHELLNP